MFFTKYFTAQYLFGTVSPQIGNSDLAAWYLGLVLLLGGIAFFVYAARIKELLKKDLLNRWGHLFFWIGLLFAFWYFLRYELIQYFSVHFVAALIFIGGLVWLYFILRYQLESYKTKRMDFEKEMLKKKYM